ncbi:chemotaxis protein CheW [Paracoccus cavernae]|uniref:chemotaxis protein CheW n=1 Tax=Paracoccus cavernae TaxID=1571207 RepID=UPI00362C0684
MENQFQQTNTNEIELLAFRLGEQEYCLDIMSVREIRGWSKATPIPFSPSRQWRNQPKGNSAARS